MIRKILQSSFEDYANIGQKTMFRAFSLFGVVILALSTLSGCMWTPMNSTNSTPYLHDKTKTMTFAGALLTPNTEVTIQAYDLQAKTWEDIAKTTSDDFIWPTGSGRYNWVEHKVIPSKYWARDQECASTGESALVRSKWAGGNLVSFNDQLFYCRSEHPNDGDFFINCRAPESPNVLIPSLNYRDFGRECVETINLIRQKEGKPRLQIYEERECEADDHSKCNYESGAHTCGPAGAHAQNECWTAGSIDEILDACIWAQMYEKEKQCYLDDPQDCYHCDQNPGCTSCECGHYVNMVLGNYTKVSCGVYEFKDSLGNWKFHSVQNYFP